MEDALLMFFLGLSEHPEVSLDVELSALSSVSLRLRLLLEKMQGAAIFLKKII